MQMSDVRRLSERLECMLIRSRFAEEVAELKPVSEILTIVFPSILSTTFSTHNNYITCSLFNQMLSAVTQACREVKNSKHFARLIEVSTEYTV